VNSKVKNKVLWIEKNKAEIREYPMPKPLPGWVLIKVMIAPICIEHRVFETGFIEWHEDNDMLGHEGVGEICELGEGVTDFALTDRVIIYQGVACGYCWVCENGLGSTHCMNLKGYKEMAELYGSHSGIGGYSQYRLAPVNMLQRIPDEMSYKHASAANCLIGCTYTGIKEQNISSEHYCLVSGIGFIGHATIVNLKHRGAKVIALGRNKQRMEFAKQMGADFIINPDDDNWLEQVKALTPQSRGVDFSFECSGYPYYQRKCLDALRHYGTMTLLGYAAHEKDLKLELNTEWDLCWGHKQITASFDVAFKDRLSLVEMLLEKPVQEKVDEMVTHQFPMSKAEEAFDLLINHKGCGCKVHLLPQE